MLPGFFHVGSFKVVDRELKLFLIAHVTVINRLPALRVTRPDYVVNAVHILKESSNALQTVSEFCRDGIKVHAAALLKISEVGYFQAVDHNLPANDTRPQRGR